MSNPFPLKRDRTACRALPATLALFAAGTAAAAPLTLNDRGYFETRGVNVLVFSNVYDGLFSDAKIAGIELIHHGVRTVTNGDVRLSPTPGQWDPVPQLVERRVDPAGQSIEAHLRYPEFDYVVRAEAQGDSVVLSVNLSQPLPAALVGRAGFNLEFLPPAYFHKTFLMDQRSANFPLHPSSAMTKSADGTLAPSPLAAGTTLVLAPEDPTRRLTLTALTGELSLYDGRNTAQNGWFVARTLIPANKTGRVVAWSLTAHSVPNWIRPPVIGHSQVGYHPAQKKVAVLELDPNDAPAASARLLRVTATGEFVEQLSAPVHEWGRYLRYHYLTFDFSAATEPGIYVIDYASTRTAPFRIAPDAFADAWHPTLDVYLPVAMDHMRVQEAHRVWHGYSHRDDARQAPVNHEHFDLYAQGPTTDTPFQPGEHIPGLAVGGWFDAGDFDIRTQTQYAVVQSLVHTWEAFAPRRDETTVDQAAHVVKIHVPDGIPDILEQIEHGALQLLAQHRAVGHAIHGIIEPDLGQYTHLGDAASKTDGLIYSPEVKPGDGLHSTVPDDRWAFTTKSTALNYGSAAGLAAASRALRGYRDQLAADCLATAKHVWDEEHSHAPDLFRHGNTTGSFVEDEEFHAAVELLLATQDPRFARRAEELWPSVEVRLDENAVNAVRLLPFASPGFRAALRARTVVHRDELATLAKQNPYGVPIFEGGWAGSERVIRFATANYMLHQAFPELIDAGSACRGLEFIFGCHPGSDISFVSGVGTVSKEVAYGSNRADFTFIAGGIVPGVLILKPDFPENKEDWPFLWGENEYVVNVGADYLFLVQAVHDLLGAGRTCP